MFWRWVSRTPATHRESYPAISGDGRWVAFNDHTSNTWILDADTPSSTAVQLPSGLFPVVDKWGGNVAVSYDYRVESEANFDYMYFEVDTSGAGDVVTVHTYTGTVSGSAAATLTEGADMRSDAGSYILSFRAYSDGAYSD